MCFYVLGAAWSRAEPLVGIFHQQPPQQVLSGASNHGGERGIAAQNSSVKRVVTKESKIITRQPITLI